MQEHKRVIKLSVSQQEELEKLVLKTSKTVTAKAIRMMTISCLEAEVKKTNVSALVIYWEESNDCWEDDKHFLPVLHKLLMGLSSFWYNVMFIWITNVAHWNYAPYLRGQDLMWEDGIWKHFQQRGKCIFQNLPALVGELKLQPLRHADILQVQYFQFKAAYNNACKMTTGWHRNTVYKLM